MLKTKEGKVKQFMKRCSVIFIIFIMMLPIFSGCGKFNVSGIEISKSFFVQVVGVDKTRDGTNKVLITATAKNPQPRNAAAPSSGEEGSSTITVTGNTVLEAVRSFHSFSGKDVFWGHANTIIIGEDCAKEDLMKYLDLFSRDHEFRNNAKVVIAKNTTAENFLQKADTGVEFIGDNLMLLLQDSDAASLSKETQLSKVLAMFSDEHSAAMIPCIELTNTSTKPKDDRDKFDIALTGFAIFKGEKLYKYITHYTARGVNWINNNVVSGVIVAQDKFGKNLSLEIVGAKSKVTPTLKDGKLNITIDIRATTNVDEQFSDIDFFKKSELEELTKKQNAIILREAQSALDMMQSEGLDVFEFADKVYHKYPIKWDKMKDNWDEVYKNAEIRINVESKIANSYLLMQSVRKNSED